MVAFGAASVFHCGLPPCRVLTGMLRIRYRHCLDALASPQYYRGAIYPPGTPPGDNTSCHNCEFRQRKLAIEPAR